MAFLFQWYICCVLLMPSSASWAFPKRDSSQYGNLCPTVRMPIKSLQKVGLIRGGASDAPSPSSLSSTPAESVDGDGDGRMDVGTKSSQEEIEGVAEVMPETSIPTELSLAVDSRGKAFFKMGPKAKSPAGFLRSTIPSIPWYAMPDYLTYMRCIAVPHLPVIYYYDPTPWHTSLLFGVASVTDWLDGFLARRWDISTNFGAFLDPVEQFSLNFWLITQKAGMGLLHASTVLTLTSGAIYFRAAAPILIDGR